MSVLAFAAAVIAGCFAVGDVAAPAEVRIFADDAGLSRMDGLTRRIQPGRKLSEPVLPPETACESQRVYVYGTVLYDAATGQFRMWYMSAGEELGGPVQDARLTHRQKGFVLYATSADGARWTRPDLGLYSFDGSMHNNIVYDFHSPSIVFNPAEGKYAMLGRGTAGETRGYLLAESADGLRWQDVPGPPALTGGDTCTLCRDPNTGAYLAFHKRSEEYRGHNRRLVYLSTSNDLRVWSEPVLVMAPDEIDDAQTRREGGICSHFYNMSAFPIAGQFLGMVTHFRYARKLAETAPAQSSQDGPIDVQLVHSRDGRAWKRFDDRAPVIPNGPLPYDAGCILGTANGPVTVGDELWLYYTAITTGHGGAIPEKKITIARAAWRLEGFVSLDAGEQRGIAETTPFEPAGRSLLVNADASNGELTVRVLDPDGTPRPGYTPIPIKTNGVRQPVKWREHNTLPNNGPIRLQFQLRNASLFSYVLD